MHDNPTVLRAKDLRNTANPAEHSLWYVLRGRQLAGYKFTRQFAVGPYYADFACRTKFLLVEIDGAQHVENHYDSERDKYLVAEGYSVLRVPSSYVLRSRDAVCEAILAALEDRLDETQSMDLTFRKSTAVPRRFTRHRPWAEHHPESWS